MAGFTNSSSLKDVLFPLTSDTHELKEQIRELETELGIVNEQLFEYDYDREFKESIKLFIIKHKRGVIIYLKMYSIGIRLMNKWELHFKVTVVPVECTYDLQNKS